MSSAPGWKKFLAKGIEHFRCQDIEKALESFDQAISLANDTSYILYDSRASAYERQNRLKDALRDAKKTIDIAPNQWHGYFRSARLFAALGQTSAALRMCSLALERLGDVSKHETRRRELTDLREHLEAQTKCPVSGIPVELLLTIFILSGNPVVISHVCRRWREIALSQPTLWRSLVLAAPAKKAPLKVQEWHKRSRGRIEELIIRKSLAVIFSSSHPDDRTMYADLLDTLRHLDLTQLKESHMEDMDVETFFFDLCDGTRYVHQHLEILSMSCTLPYDAMIFGCQYELPWENLRAFSIFNGGCDWAQLSTSMRRLTSFEYKMERSISVFEQFREFLQANPGLEKLVIESGLYHPHFHPEAPDTLTLAHLRHLELTGHVPFRIERGKFSLPSLQILRMTKLKNAEFILAELVEDKGTSFEELVEFTARGCSLGWRILTSALIQAPKLVILNCTGNAVNVVAESLAKPCVAFLKDPTSEDPTLIPTELPILCPALSVLDLSQSADLKTGPVMRIVKERIALAASQDGGCQLPGQDGNRGVSCIQALSVDECPHIEADMLPWFRKNVPKFSCRYELRRKR
ncbi:hypothetical protein EDB92DRAFT_1177704 [Lactarius akahatsu]|uniref:F-box domain-containing protein n=1 Tax=Lactarius akahatsu TaxID=416441 RepID=A0AAD4QGX7_9AGAM|nr:hypothetical protein EDB92DRAFT_1177704 [Lactarius akahatsu]